MKSTLGTLFPRMGTWQPRSIKLASVVIPLITGLILALLLFKFGQITLPIIFFLLLVLPWLLQDVFRLFIWLIITWPILTLYVRIPLPAGIPDLSYDRVLVLLLLCVIILDALLAKRRLMKITRLDILVLIYVAAQISSRVFVIWFGGMGRPDLNGLLDIIIIPLALYWIAKNLLVSRVRLKWLLYALVIASLLICLTGLYEQAMGVRIFKGSTRLGGTEEQYLWQDVPGGRAAGAMGNPAIYGATLGMGILAGFVCLSHTKWKLTRAVLVVTIGVLLYGIFASYTRSAWVSVFIVLFAAQFLIRGLWKKTLLILSILLFVLVLIWNVLPNISTVMNQAVNRATYSNSLPIRADLMHLSWERFLEKPFLGWGSGAINTFSLRQVGDTSHNIYLTFLVDGGLVLFLSFFAVAVYILIRAIRIFGINEKSSLERNVIVVVAGSILIFLMSGLALELRYFAYFNALFWVCAGVIDCLGVRLGSKEISIS